MKNVKVFKVGKRLNPPKKKKEDKNEKGAVNVREK